MFVFTTSSVLIIEINSGIVLKTFMFYEHIYFMDFDKAYNTPTLDYCENEMDVS